jgi:4-hydroxy-2-oxoglutarate aldolase
MAELVAAVVTPFRPDGGVDHAAFAANLAGFAESPLTGVLILGTTGEHPFLDFTEKVELIEVAARHRSRLDLYVQVWHQDNRHTKALAEIAHANGAKAAVALTPTYYTPNYDRSVLRHYFGELVPLGPTYLYHIPRNTGMRITPDDVAALAGDGVAGMKDSSGDLVALAEVLADLEGFRAFTGAGEGLLAAVALGAAGGMLAIAQVAPHLAHEVLRHLDAGDLPAARAAQRRLTRLSVLLGRRHGIAGVKYALDRLGLHGGAPRRPLPPLDEPARRAIDDALTSLGVPAYGR